MKATLRMGGQMMVDVQVSVALSLGDMADLYTARWREEAVEFATKKPKSRVMQEIRDDIACSGTEYAGYAVGDGDLNNERDEVLAVFEKRFAKEFNL